MSRASDSGIRTHLHNLRTIIRSLPATGPFGFEGLMSAALTAITGIPFRLAGSGSQYGVDGKSTYEDDAVCFEGKRYDETIPKEKLLSKLVEVSTRSSEYIDLWVLGATAQVMSQHVDIAREFSRKNGFHILILDWSENNLPPLAVALAMAESAVSDFLKVHIIGCDISVKAATAFEAVKSGPDWLEHSERIRKQFHEATLGNGFARQANNRWLTAAFSDKRQAKKVFLQPLAPADKELGESAPRTALVAQLNSYLISKPDGRIVALLGSEGNGKSWLFAQSWLTLSEKPLMIVFTAENFVGVAPENCREELIGRLIAQTEGHSSEATKRWERWLNQWRHSKREGIPRLIIVIDGLNQRANFDWARIVDAMNSELDKIGGRLVITARTDFYESKIKRRLDLQCLEMRVPEFSEEERDEILSKNGVDGGSLSARVAKFLCNPRLLGIAINLLSKSEINGLEELSVDRLLFEHILAYERDSPTPRSVYEFAHILQGHAQKVLDRVQECQFDDFTLFRGELEAVVDGRFFIPLPGDPTRYSLVEEGLRLALGFAILDAMRAAERNKGHLNEKLAVMLEPLSALDRVAEAVFAALTIFCLDSRYSDDIGIAILLAFSDLQNPMDFSEQGDPKAFSAFAALAQKKPMVFLGAAKNICLFRENRTNFDWIEAALQEAKEAESAWLVMEPVLQSWLKHYSLSPEVHTFKHPNRNSAQEVAEERRKRREEINAKLEEMSSVENDMLLSLTRSDEGDIASLGRISLKLMAGKPIAPFASALTHWSFASALNPDFGTPHSEFRHLLTFNRTDWHATRVAVLQACATLESSGISHTGKWALVSLLKATGDSDDAKKAQVLAGELASHRSKFQRVTRVENYCETDPCDPHSAVPENIAMCAKQYNAIDVSTLWNIMGRSAEDFFFESARPGIVRFEPDIAINKHRELVLNVIGRQGISLRQGMLEIKKHNSLFLHQHVNLLVEYFNSGAIFSENYLSDDDKKILSQYSLILAFPFLNSDEQINVILSEYIDSGFILEELLGLAKPFDDGKVVSLLNAANARSDVSTQYKIFAYSEFSNTPISEAFRKHILAAIQSKYNFLRTQALRLIAKNLDRDCVNAVLESDWRCSSENQDIENWFGSLILIDSVSQGLTGYENIIDRISPELYGFFAEKLGGSVAGEVARRIDVSFQLAAGFSSDLSLPEIELIREENDNMPPRFSLDEPKNFKELEGYFPKISESCQDFDERQGRIANVFAAFKDELKVAKANMILDWCGAREIRAISQNRALVDNWICSFFNMPRTSILALFNFGLSLANVCSEWNPDQATKLFQILRNKKSFVRMIYQNGISHERHMYWSLKDHPTLNELLFDRLDSAKNDGEMSEEITSALIIGRKNVLREYVENGLRTSHPEMIARALMVVGFSEQDEFNDSVLERFQGAFGFIGKAWSEAKYAYERNVWAKHWFTMMLHAQSNEEFWRYSILLLKIVDSRIYVWGNSDGAEEPFRLFWQNCQTQLQHRIKKWQYKRSKKLFGEDVPSEVFMSGSRF